MKDKSVENVYAEMEFLPAGELENYRKLAKMDGN